MFNQLNLELCFNGAKENNSKYVGVLIKTPDSKKVVICDKNDFDHELQFYKDSYTDDLKHKHAEGLEIIGFTFGNSYSVLEYDLILPENIVSKTVKISIRYKEKESPTSLTKEKANEILEEMVLSTERQIIGLNDSSLKDVFSFSVL